MQYLEKTRVYLLGQQRMLETSLNWGILTISPIVLIFFAGAWEAPLGRYLAVTVYLSLVEIEFMNIT